MVGRIGMGLRLHGLQKAVDAITTVKEGYGQDAKWIVGVGAEYGAYLEFGTSRMQAYPFLFPAARHVMREKFDRLERQARDKSQPIPWLVEELALAIEEQAKVNADANQEAFSGQRSPGTHPDHPAIDKSVLVGSIEASDARAFR